MSNGLSKIISIVIVLGLNWAGISAVGTTVASFNDSGISSGNTFTAGVFDITADPSTFSKEISSTQITQSIVIDYSTATVSGKYTMTASEEVESEHAVCTALTAELKDVTSGAVVYTGDLLGLTTPNINMLPSNGESYNLRVGTSTLFTASMDGKTCKFKIQIDAWNADTSSPGTGGFQDTEIIFGNITAKVNVLTDDSVSPIRDSYVDKNAVNNNYGTQNTFSVDSYASRTRRAFVGFDFHLPAGTEILSSNLLLYMTTAPSSSRTYGVERVLASWTETGITWTNQPTAFTTPTSAITTGTTDKKWLSWDVTSDVTGMVSGSITNNGWRISDSAETSASSVRATFVSSEGAMAQRPVLEVSFTTPPASTNHLVVNEVYYDVGAGMGTNGNNQWVEIYNPTSQSVDISGWKICDASGTCDTIPTSTILPSKQFAVFANKADTWTHWPDIPAGALKIAFDSKIGNGLSTTGDRVILKNASNVEIDSMSYGTDTTELNPSVPVSTNGNSLARIVKGYDSDVADDWVINATPNPGTNPSSSGSEIMRFTEDGILVADYDAGLEPLLDGVATTEVTEVMTDETTTPGGRTANDGRNDPHADGTTVVTEEIYSEEKMATEMALLMPTDAVKDATKDEIYSEEKMAMEMALLMPTDATTSGPEEKTQSSTDGAEPQIPVDTSDKTVATEPKKIEETIVSGDGMEVISLPDGVSSPDGVSDPVHDVSSVEIRTESEVIAL